MKILHYPTKAVEINGGIVYVAGESKASYYYDDPSDTDYYTDNAKELIEKAGIEVVARIGDEQAKANLEDAYGSTPVSVVIKYQDKLYRSDGEFGSYGTAEWTEWLEVEGKPKTMIVYDYV